MSGQEKAWRAEEREVAAKECYDINGLDHCAYHLELIEKRVASRIAIAQRAADEQERALEAAVVKQATDDYALGAPWAHDLLGDRVAELVAFRNRSRGTGAG